MATIAVYMLIKQILVFGAVKLTRKTTKRKFIYNDQRNAFDGSSLWHFGNQFDPKCCDFWYRQYFFIINFSIIFQD